MFVFKNTWHLSLKMRTLAKVCPTSLFHHRRLLLAFYFFSTTLHRGRCLNRAFVVKNGAGYHRHFALKDTLLTASLLRKRCHLWLVIDQRCWFVISRHRKRAVRLKKGVLLWEFSVGSTALNLELSNFQRYLRKKLYLMFRPLKERLC